MNRLLRSRYLPWQNRDLPALTNVARFSFMGWQGPGLLTTKSDREKRTPCCLTLAAPSGQEAIMKHPPVSHRVFALLGGAGLIVALACGATPCLALGQAAPVPPLSPNVAHHPKHPLPTSLKPWHAPTKHHQVERGPLLVNVPSYSSGPQQTIQGFRKP